jgi:hypothetical protein
MALGALIIKEKLGISDRETVEQIRENPYLQYFIGQLTYSNELAFDPSLLVHFRQRISPNLINKVNERMVEKCAPPLELKPKKKKDSDAKNESLNRGKLIIDATCAPADISYPKLFCIKTGIIINQKSQRIQKYASQKSFKFRASQKASTILKTRRKWTN